jgi:VWFA-related protein
LSAIQGRRKSLILFTDGQIAAGGFHVPQDRGFTAEEWLRTGQLFNNAWGSWTTPTEFAGRSDVHVYPVDARGLVALAPAPGNATDVAQGGRNIGIQFQDHSTSVWTLRTLATQTGGQAIVNNNDYREGFSSIVTDNSRYYLLGYDSPQKDRDGRFIQINVRTTRPGLIVRAREGYIAR